MNDGVGIAGIFILYTLPGIVAWWRNHHNMAAILALDLLLGWTVIGWVIALVWSLTYVAQKQGGEST